MRDSRSRPSWSVPSGKSRDGASLRRAKFDFVYGSGARKSAKIAMTQSSAITIPPATASLLRLRQRTASRQRLEERMRGSSTGAVTATATRLTSVPDPGVEDPVEEVDHEVHDGQERAVRQYDGHDHRVVAAGHRQHEEAAHAGDPKDRLDEERAGPHRREHRAQQGHHGDERVLERVLEDDRQFAKPLGAR